MHARLALIITVAMLAAAMIAPTALAAPSALPVELAPGEELISHTSSSAQNSRYIADVLSSIKGVKIGADKTTVLVNAGDKTHPIEIDYSSALSGGAKGDAGPTDDSSGSSSGVGLGQIAGLLLGLTIISRVIGIVRQLGAGNR